MTANKVLILFAHPDKLASRVNARLLQAAESVEGVTVHDLYHTYPAGRIDIAYEQNLLRVHDAVIMQFPFYWYSAPSLLKEWKDVVLQYGFAFGEGGDALENKPLHLVITTGGAMESYHPDGHNRFPIDELLRPFEQTAHFCRMKYKTPFIISDVYQLSDAEIEAYAEKYTDFIRSAVMQLS